jgi:hypothetical protein
MEDEERVRVIAAAAANVAANAAAADAYRAYVVEVAFNRAYEAAHAAADEDRARVYEAHMAAAQGPACKAAVAAWNKEHARLAASAVADTWSACA